MWPKDGGKLTEITRETEYETVAPPLQDSRLAVLLIVHQLPAGGGLLGRDRTGDVHLQTYNRFGTSDTETSHTSKSNLKGQTHS